jgi:hypothetical protein
MYKLKLNQIREVLGLEVKLEIVKLVDGVTQVEYEKMEPGFPLFVIAEDGSTKTPAPAGYHKLEDGTTIEVDAAGIIVEVSNETEEVEEEAPVATEDVIEVSGEEVAVEEPVSVAMEDILPVIEEKVAEKMKMIFEVVEEVATEVASIKEEMGAMKTKMEKFSKMPAANAAPKMTANAEKIDSFEAKLDFIKSLKK